MSFLHFHIVDPNLLMSSSHNNYYYSHYGWLWCHVFLSLSRSLFKIQHFLLPVSDYLSYTLQHANTSLYSSKLKPTPNPIHLWHKQAKRERERRDLLLFTFCHHIINITCLLPSLALSCCCGILLLLLKANNLHVNISGRHMYTWRKPNSLCQTSSSSSSSTTLKKRERAWWRKRSIGSYECQKRERASFTHSHDKLYNVHFM